MNCSKTETHWTDFLDRALPPAESRAMDLHLRECPNCRSQAEIFRQIDQRLRIECGLLTQSLPAGPQSAAAQQRFLAFLKESAAVSNAASKPGEASERLWRVRRVLALLCGPNTGGRMIESAGDSREPHWAVFLQRLSFLTTEICGRHAGELILAVGND